MSKRIDVMIDEDIGDSWAEFRRAGAAAQSTMRYAPGSLGGGAATRLREMTALRTQLPKIKTEEVTRWIREDREHGH